MDGMQALNTAALSLYQAALEGEDFLASLQAVLVRLGLRGMILSHPGSSSINHWKLFALNGHDGDSLATSNGVQSQDVELPDEIFQQVMKRQPVFLGSGTSLLQAIPPCFLEALKIDGTSDGSVSTILAPCVQDAGRCDILAVSGPLAPTDQAAVSQFAQHVGLILKRFPERSLERSLERSPERSPEQSHGAEIAAQEIILRPEQADFTENFQEDILQQIFDGVAILDETGDFSYLNPAAAQMLGYDVQDLMGKPWTEIVPPEYQEIVRQADERRRQGSSDRYELELIRKDGSRFFAQVSGSPRIDNGIFLGTLAVFTDISERKHAEHELERRTAQLVILHQLSLELTVSFNLSALLTRIVEQAAGLLHARGASIYMCDVEKREVHLTTECDQTKQNYIGVKLKYGEGAAGYVAETSQPLILDDYREWEGRAAVYEVEKPYSAVLSVPILWDEQVIGVLQVMADSSQRKFSQEDQDILSLFADQAAFAIETTRLLENEHRMRMQAEMLREVTKTMSGSLELDELLRLILGQLGSILAFNTASVVLYDAQARPELIVGVGYAGKEETSLNVGDLLESSPILARMAQDLEPVLLEDVRTNSDWIWMPGAEHVVAFMGVPIVLGGKMIGVIMMDSITPNFFEEDDLHMAQTLAQHMAVAIQNARLFQAERKAREHAEALREAALVIGSTLSLDQVLGVVLDQLQKVLPFDSGSIILVKGDVLEVKIWRGYDRTIAPELAKMMRFDLATNQTAGEVVRNGVPLMITNVQQDPRWIYMEASEYINSWMGVPLRTRDQISGLVSLDRTSPNGFSADEIDLAQNFATGVAAAIANANLYEAQEQRTAELLAVRRAALSLTSNLDLNIVLNRILESMLAFLPESQRACIFLYEEANGDHLVFGAGLWGTDFSGDVSFTSEPHELDYSVARTGQTIILEDVKTQSIFEDRAETLFWQGAVIGQPLKIGQRVVGVLNISYPKEHIFFDSELRVIGMLADQAAIAVENARLYERAAAERLYLRLIFDLGKEIAGMLDIDEILNRAINLTCQALGGVLGEALIYDPVENGLTLRAIYGQSLDHLRNLGVQLKLPLGRGLVGWVAQTMQSALVPDVTKNPYWVQISGLDDDAHSGIVAPIIDGVRLLGVIAVLHREKNAFNQDHLDLLQAICQQVGLALSNSFRYHQVESLVDLLAEEQIRMEGLVERLPIGVLLLDSGYRVLVANDQAAQILNELNGDTNRLQLTNLGPMSIDDLVRSHSHSAPVEIAKNGPPRSIYEVEARPIGGENRQWVLTLRDVTQERENQVRTSIQERLATVGQLAAGIAHDFNNIMAAILVYTDLMMRDQSLPSDSRERLEIIQQQVQRASSLIRQILDFSRRSVMEQSPLDLLPFLKEMHKLLSRLLPENIQLELDYEPGVYSVNADPTRLQQIFMNLALNSRDAMPQGGRLHFQLNKYVPGDDQPRSRPELEEGEWIGIVVEDTGAGIPQDVLPHIFDPFYTTKPVGRGVGLGLAQVYGIVQQHRGYIDVESQTGRGACFSIYLPALPSPVQGNIPDISAPRFDGGGMTVLVVEDDQTTRAAVQALLLAHDFRVLTASDGAQALNIYREYQDMIVLVVTDVVMPEMGGLALYQMVRKLNPAVKVLFVTGHPLNNADQILLEKGDVYWLQKPFSIDEFARVIQEMLNLAEIPIG